MMEAVDDVHCFFSYILLLYYYSGNHQSVLRN